METSQNFDGGAGGGGGGGTGDGIPAAAATAAGEEEDQDEELGDEVGIIYTCPFCTKVFLSESVAEAHLEEHERSQQILRTVDHSELDLDEFILGIESSGDDSNPANSNNNTQKNSSQQQQQQLLMNGHAYEFVQEEIVTLNEDEFSSLVEQEVVITTTGETEIGQQQQLIPDQPMLTVYREQPELNSIPPRSQKLNIGSKWNPKVEDLFHLVQKKVVRICLEDIQHQKVPCEYCFKQITMLELNFHHHKEHADELLKLRRVAPLHRQQRTTSARSRRSRSTSSQSPLRQSSQRKSARTPLPQLTESPSTQRRRTGLNGTFTFGSSDSSSPEKKRVRNSNRPSTLSTLDKEKSQRRRSPAGGRKPYKCKFCSKSFVAPSQCKSHENTHTAAASSVTTTTTSPPETTLKIEDQQGSSTSDTKMAQDLKQVPMEVGEASLESKRQISLAAGAEARADPAELPEADNEANLANEQHGSLPDLGIPNSQSEVKLYGEDYLNPLVERPVEAMSDSSLENMKENLSSPPPPPITNQVETCQTCGEEIPMAIFVDHIYAHLQKNQRECSLCDHLAHTFMDLKDHLHSKHYGLKPYQCPLCQACFAWKSGLKGHTCHGSSAGKPFKCHHCRMRFETNRERRRHELVHTNISGPSGVGGGGGGGSAGTGVGADDLGYQQQQQLSNGGLPKINNNQNQQNNTNNNTKRNKRINSVNSVEMEKLGPGAARRRRINAADLNSSEVLKTKHNIVVKKTPSPSSPIRPNTLQSIKISSPELDSILDNYVHGTTTNYEQVIELDPMTEDYSFMSSLTKPSSNPSFGYHGQEREPIVAVAFAMTGSAGSDNTATSATYQNWPPNTPTTATINTNNISNNNLPYGTNHVMANNVDHVPQILQQQQQQAGIPATINQIMPGPSHRTPTIPHPPIGVVVDEIDLDNELDEDDGEVDEEEEEEYYRDEDKRYVEPPDKRVQETCKTCHQIIPMTHLRDHIQSHVVKGQLECSICNYKAFNSKYLLDHLNIHYSLKPYKCEKCGRHFTFGGYLRSHIKQVHMKSKTRPHECRYCDKKFVRPCHRRTHERTHKGEQPKPKPAPPSSSETTNSSTPTPTPPPIIPGTNPIANHINSTTLPTPNTPKGFKTPVKKHSVDLTAEMLVNSPANIQPKMTATWPPMNPQYQDPWLNPIHSDSPQQLLREQQQQQQQQQQLGQGLPGFSQNYAASSPTSTDTGLYYNYQSNSVVNNVSPGAMYQHSRDPKLYQAPTTLNYPGQPQPPPQQQQQGSQSQILTFGSSTGYPQNPQQPQPTNAWPQSRAPPQPPAPAVNQRYNSVYPGSPSGATSTFYYEQSTNFDFGGASPNSSNAGLYNNNTYNSVNLNSVTLPPISSTVNHPSQLLEPTIIGSNNNSTLYSSGTAGGSFDLGTTFGFNPPNFDSSIGGALQSQASGGYSITTPCTSTFDLWAELRDEELKLFPETNTIYSGSDPFPSFSRSVTDDLLGLPQPSFYNSASMDQQHFNNFYDGNPFIGGGGESPLAPPFGTSPSYPPASTQFPPNTSSPSLFDMKRIKVKIKKLQGQSYLISHPPAPVVIKKEPRSFDPPAPSGSTTTGSREVLPTGGRRLSSDDLNDLIELTNQQCQICHAQLGVGGEDILEHISSHLARGQTHCKICDHTFSNSWYLKVHTYKHYGIKLYECTYCHRKFSKQHSLAAHIDQAHVNDGESKSQACEYCKKIYKSRFALRRHLKDVHRAVLRQEGATPAKVTAESPSGSPSKFMNSVFSSSARFNNNSRIFTAHSRLYQPRHAEPAGDEGKELELRISEENLSVFGRSWVVPLENIGLKKTTCPICKEEIHIRDMLSHKSDHQEQCHICGKTVPASELISHGSTHVSSLYCEICNWKGKQKSQIWEHMNGHLGNKPLKCEYCGVGFASRSSVRLHTIARHTNIRLHKCDFCDARFVTPQVKRMHQLQHYDTNCPFCNKYFALKKDLATHIRKHYKMAGQKLVLKDDVLKEGEEEEEEVVVVEHQQQQQRLKQKRQAEEQSL